MININFFYDLLIKEVTLAELQLKTLQKGGQKPKNHL